LEFKWTEGSQQGSSVEKGGRGMDYGCGLAASWNNMCGPMPQISEKEKSNLRSFLPEIGQLVWWVKSLG